MNLGRALMGTACLLACATDVKTQTVRAIPRPPAQTFSFLPDGRIIVGERPGRIKIVGKDGKVSGGSAGITEQAEP